MEAMSEILLDRLAQESSLVAYESLNEILDETLDEPSDETAFWTVNVSVLGPTAPVSNSPLGSPGNSQARVQAISH